MMLDGQRSARADVELIDTAAILADLDKLSETYGGRETELRTAAAQRLKSALGAARAQAEQVLLKDRHGRRCAARLCEMHDEIIRILFEFVTQKVYPPQVRSETERMTVVATGGYGRGLMAPESDIDLLFILPYKQTAWGEQVAEAILYCLWAAAGCEAACQRRWCRGFRSASIPAARRQDAFAPRHKAPCVLPGRFPAPLRQRFYRSRDRRSLGCSTR